MNKIYAEIIVDNRSSQVDRPFVYKVKREHLEEIEVGMRVLIPFGRSNKIIKGFVIGLLDQFESKYNIKYIKDILDDKPLVSNELIELGEWIRKEYLASYIDSFQPILPPGDFKKIKNNISVRSKVKGLTNNEQELYSYIDKLGVISLEELKKEINIKDINKLVRSLEAKGAVDIKLEIVTDRNKKTEQWIRVIELSEEKAMVKIGSRAKKQKEIYSFVLREKDISMKELLLKLNTSSSTVRELEKKKLIEIYTKVVFRDPIKREVSDYKKLELYPNQKNILIGMLNLIESKIQNKFLLHGITGSGKTEIYLQMVEEVLKRGKDTIVLVPEISLTPQTIDRFVGRFGNKVAVFHSRLSHGERFDEWRKIRDGNVKIVVGARSAIFAPFNNLGLIIIDEEHESSYKSFQNPKYNTIDVAIKRSEIEGASVIFGSATPSLETYYKAKNGELELMELSTRANMTALPDIEIVDMREELNIGNKSIFSRSLYQALQENLENKQQSILFLNRRGFSTFVSCRSCGYVVKCNDCDVSMTYHKYKNQLKCHYCGLAVKSPEICPVCKSPYIKYFGIGTERIESEIRSIFPDARVMRMDGDTTAHKDSYFNKLNKMKNKEIDILVGTQMISKGLDFENVTLVGVVAADINLNLPDFRSPEKTFQLITQVAGRAGRGQYEGKVVLQTYNPEHYSIEYAKKHDYIGFYNKEIAIRKMFNYPPYTNLISILVYGENNFLVEKLTKEVYSILIGKYNHIFENPRDYIIGPYPAPIEKIKSNYRWQILLKINNDNLINIKKDIYDVCILNKHKLKNENVKISIDINPNSIL